MVDIIVRQERSVKRYLELNKKSKGKTRRNSYNITLCGAGKEKETSRVIMRPSLVLDCP